jgi:hypothetical protein
MSAEEKAKAGIWLLKEAVLEFVKDHPGATSREVKDALSLASPNEKDEREDQLLWGIDNMLMVEGRMRMEKPGHLNQRYFIK